MGDVNGNHDFNRNFICIEYPGVVKNVDKMLETLGGLKTVSSVYSEKKRRLELRFRPDDLFSKPACGDRHSTSALLLRVKVRRKKRSISKENLSIKNDQTENSDSQGVLSYETSVVGQISTVYRFTSMCDFQYLPVITGKDGCIKSAYEDVVPLTVKDYSWILDPEAPLFIVPPSFSRVDMPQSYSFRRGKTEVENPEKLGLKSSAISRMYPKSVIGRARCRRSLHTIFVSWPKVWAASRHAKPVETNRGQALPSEAYHSERNDESIKAASFGPSCSSTSNNTNEGVIPMRPEETAVRLLRIKFLCGEQFIRIQKYLEERPMLSRNALLALTKLSQDELKYLLPAVAYYFINGPWRGAWARFGYDPTRHPSARQYQTLDFRLRKLAGMNINIKAKRSSINCSQPYKWTSYSRLKVPLMKKLPPDVSNNEEGDNDESDEKLEALYIFRPGLLPPSMQMFYQYCDLQVPEIQEMLNALPMEPDAVCSEKTGWLPAGFDEKCRDIINDYVLKKTRNLNKKS